jgi:hypothetical protein
MFGMAGRPVLVAHQGGWDEVLLVAGPLVAIAGLLLLAKRRVDRAAAQLSESASPDANTDTSASAPEQR